MLRPTDVDHTNHNVLARENQVKEINLYVKQATGRFAMNFTETHPQARCTRTVFQSEIRTFVVSL